MTPAPLTLARIRELRAFSEEWPGRHSVDQDEMLHLLAAAEALARLEAWLGEHRIELVCWKSMAEGSFTVMFSGRNDSDDARAPTLLAALAAALDQVEGKPIEMQGP